MTKQTFIHGDFEMSYLEWGSGVDTVLCFHGFGRQANDYQIFTPLLTSNQRLIAVDLHAHGTTSFTARQDTKPWVAPQEWLEFMEVFFLFKSIKKFHLMGYSMGGRIALCLWQWKPHLVQSLFLAATDGLNRNLLYRFASGTVLGRKFYRMIIDKPQFLFTLAGLLKKSGILHPKLYRFVHVHLDTKTKRQQVYDSWLAYRYFFPNLRILGQIHGSNAIPFFLIFGKNDSVIRPKLAQNLLNHFNTKVEVYYLDAGHRLLNADLIDFIRDHDAWPK
jgi:pimeloyl-ACP methyl ester carboxylesterase